MLESADSPTAVDDGKASGESRPDTDEEAEMRVSSPELIGMLYGIACDGKVNIREAKMLRKWLATVDCGDDAAVRKIVNLLEKVLDDDVVTEDEETEMLSLFNRVAGLDEVG